VSEDRKRCFVIMPFSQTTVKRTEDYWTKHFKFFLKPLIEDCSLEAHRSKPLRGSIVKQIITDLVKSSVVVADITDANPNVYWELGVRQSFRHGTIMIAQKGTDPPFDIKDTGILFYDPDHLDADGFSNDFKAAITDCLENPDRTDSPVLETLSGRGTLYEIIRREEILRRLDAVLSECDYNLNILKEIIERAKHNQENLENRMIMIYRFRLYATELLATNSYVDEDSSFYTRVENYWSILSMLNSQLELWVHPHFRDLCEKTPLETEEVATKLFKTFKDTVETVRAKIERKQY